MTREQKIEQIAKFIVHTTFKLKEGDTLVITSDYGSHHDINEAVSRETYAAGAKCLIIKTAPAPSHGKIADTVVAYKPFTAMMKEANYWLDTGTMGWLYSDAFEDSFVNNPNLHYMLISIMDVDELMDMLLGCYSPEMQAMTDYMAEMILKAKGLRVTNHDGTDFTFEIDTNNRNNAQIGLADKPGFYTPPAMYNMIPKYGTLQGKAVVRCIYADPWGMAAPTTVNFKDGKIDTITSEDSTVAKKFTAWLESKNEENIYKISHINFGLLPKLHEFSDHGIKNERMWGGINLGFGHTSPVDMRPNGQTSCDHLDIIADKCDVWVDDTKVMENGEFVGPFKSYADAVLKVNGML